MEYMFTSGFLGTKAPFFMDFVMIVVVLLPFLVLFGVGLIRKGYYGFHTFYQVFIFIISVVVVGWFEYGVRVGGGFNSFIEGNPRSITLMLMVLIIHIIISTVTTIYWAKILWQSYGHYRDGNLPGGFSVRHISRVKLTMLGIFMTALTGIWVYLLLFVY
jgi:putative membrane protein